MENILKNRAPQDRIAGDIQGRNMGDNAADAKAF